MQQNGNQPNHIAVRPADQTTLAACEHLRGVAPPIRVFKNPLASSAGIAVIGDQIDFFEYLPSPAFCTRPSVNSL